MMLQNVMSHSQYYSSKLSKDVKRGNDEQRKRGWLTGQAIEGYSNARSPDGMSHGIIVKDPERFTLRRRMWDLMLTGRYSVPHIAKIAGEQWGYRTRGSRRHLSGKLSRNGLYSMFKNPRYAGLIPSPDRLTQEKAAYEPMVTIAEFDTVQAMLSIKNTRTQKEPKPFAFRGIIFCGECGCSITAETKTKRFKNGTSKQYTYYHCTRKRPCSQRSGVREEELQTQFSDTLKKYTILPQFKDWALEVLESQNEIESTDISAVLETQSRTIEASHKEMKRLIQMAAKELIDETQFKQEKVELEKRIAGLEEERDDTKKRAENWYDTVSRVFDLAVHGRERFLNGDLTTKKEMLADFGQNPILLNGELKLTPHPWFVPIENDYKNIETEFDKVRTLPQQIQEEALASVRSSWLGIVNLFQTFDNDLLFGVG